VISRISLVHQRRIALQALSEAAVVSGKPDGPQPTYYIANLNIRLALAACAIRRFQRHQIQMRPVSVASDPRP